MFARTLQRTLAGIVAAAAAAMLLGFSPASGTAAAPAAERTYTVRPGDTLWAIAVHRYPSSDPRDAVARIQAANGGAGSVLFAGEVLRLP